NPKSTDGMLPVGKYRTPSPGSPQTPYVPPKTPNAKVANNYYFNRDTRRNYPRLAVYTQQDVAGLLMGGKVQESLPSVGADSQPVTDTKLVTPSQQTYDLAQVVAEQQVAFGNGVLPPTPGWGKKVEWNVSTDHEAIEEGIYWPMKQYV
ncbi:hypothetical protein BZG36_04446, partial [Bifiguratus adelaidae]